MEEDLIAPFVVQWELDAISEKVLRKCAPTLQNDIMTKFKPKDTSRNCNALFMAFVKSLRRDDPEYAAHDPALNIYSGGYAGQLGGQILSSQMPYMTFPAPPPPAFTPVFPPVPRTPQASHFLVQWQLSAEATNFLDSLCGPVQDEVIRDFSHRIVDEDRTGDPSIAFLKFARERAVKVFIDQWQLDAESWTLLLSLPPDTQVITMASFNPGDLANLNQQFQFFASSCQAATSMPSVGNPALRNFQQRWPNDQTIASGGSIQDLEYFILQWKLDVNSSTFLRSLLPATQTDIMTSFYPKDTSRDCNGIFMSFAKSRLSGTRSPGAAQGQSSAPPDLGILDAKKPEDIDKFVSGWALNAASEELLKESSMETVQIVMSEFRPHDVFRDVNSVFQAFVRSRAEQSQATESPRAQSPRAKRARQEL